MHNYTGFVCIESRSDATIFALANMVNWQKWGKADMKDSPDNKKFHTPPTLKVNKKTGKVSITVTVSNSNDLKV